MKLHWFSFLIHSFIHIMTDLAKQEGWAGKGEKRKQRLQVGPTGAGVS